MDAGPHLNTYSGKVTGACETGGVAYYLLANHIGGVKWRKSWFRRSWEMTTGFAGLGIDLPHAMFLPNICGEPPGIMARLDPAPEDLEAFMQEVGDFALQEYAPALLMGSRLADADRSQLLAKLSRYTGLSEEYWDKGEPAHK